MILIDTSAWIEFFRGRDPMASAVDAALETGQAALCGPIETELRRGLVGERERTKVLSLLAGCHRLVEPPNLWTEAGDLGFALRKRGVTAKTVDLLIAAHALHHSTSLLTTDRDFSSMHKAGVPLSLQKG
jgi:tRNA(fMet)-specific endonuclease VapC